MFNFTDTETSDPKFQRICQLACILTDEQGNELEVLNTLIKPDGWEVHPRFVEIHGITTEMCWNEGRPMQEVLAKYGSLIDRTKKVICHNYTFDSGRLINEMQIYGMLSLANIFLQTASFCTMKELTSVCCLPNANGRAGYKWPKLKEAHKHFFGVEFEDQHDALADNRACKRIYFEMFKPPAVSPAAIVQSAEAPKEDDFGAAPIL